MFILLIKLYEKWKIIKVYNCNHNHNSIQFNSIVDLFIYKQLKIEGGKKLGIDLIFAIVNSTPYIV